MAGFWCVSFVPGIEVCFILVEINKMNKMPFVQRREIMEVITEAPCMQRRESIGVSTENWAMHFKLGVIGISEFL
jgi:hypothetical protein